MADRGGMDLMPELGTKPVNKYLPPRPKDRAPAKPLDPIVADMATTGIAGWLDRLLEKF